MRNIVGRKICANANTSGKQSLTSHRRLCDIPAPEVLATPAPPPAPAAAVSVMSATIFLPSATRRISSHCAARRPAVLRRLRVCSV